MLALHAAPYIPQRPVIGLDERPWQWLMGVWETLPIAAGRSSQGDDTYERNGSCNRFLVFQPLTERRKGTVTARRPSEACAYPLTALVDDIFPDADVIRVVLDNLNPIRQRLYTRPFRRGKPGGLLAGWRFIPRRSTAGG